VGIGSNMLNINFEGKLTFWDLMNFSNEHNIDIYDLCHTALTKEAIFSEEINLLSDFIDSLTNKNNLIQSQLLQDAFASFVIGEKYKKTFLEFGATDGVSLSNSYMLENSYKWIGLLAEPSPQWHDELKNNRPNTKILTKCIWKSSGEKLDFFVSNVGELSSINDFIHSDLSSMPGNTQARVQKGKVVEVETISINDAIKNNFGGDAPSYISIDTEGSEYEILQSFDFEKYQPVLFTIEHNFTDLENKIDELMHSNGYVRVFKEITAFDAWYVNNKAMQIIN
jgi:FkbM family methyltransferase